jgi:hypothetical protein
MNWTEPFQRKKSKSPKAREEMLNIPDHKENANQHHVNIPPHSR